MFKETLTAAIESIIEYAEDRGAEVDIDQVWEELSRPMPYGTETHKHFEIAALKGKRTKKYFHASIWRTERGRYEVNCYIL